MATRDDDVEATGAGGPAFLVPVDPDDVGDLTAMHTALDLAGPRGLAVDGEPRATL